MSVFKNQGFLTLTLETGVDLTTASTIGIKYRKPSGVSGIFDCELVGTTKLKHDFSNTELDMEGSWQVQAYAVLAGLSAYGDVTNFNVTRGI